MASTKVKVIGAVVVVILIVAVIAAVVIATDDDDDSSDSSSSSSTKNQVRYNYSIELMDSFENKYGYTDNAGTGSQYAVVTYTVANDGYAGGVSENYYTFDFALSYGGTSWTPSNVYTTEYPSGYDSSAYIAVGHTASFVLVYKISSSATLDGIKVTPDYWTLGTAPTFVYDPTL